MAGLTAKQFKNLLPQANNEPVTSTLATVLNAVKGVFDPYKIPEGVPLLGGQSAADLTGLTGAQGVVQDFSRGNLQSGDMRMFDLLGLGAGVAPAARTAVKGGGLLGKEALEQMNNNRGLLSKMTIDPRQYMATKSVAEDGYKLQHTAPMKDETNSPLHALANTFGDDIYTPQAAQYYGDSGGRDAMDIASARLMQSFKGKPDEMVTMYRAVPRGVDNINHGDWVTINKEYAKRHGDSHLDGDFVILEKKVPARELFTDGNSLHEFGYDQSVKKN